MSSAGESGLTDISVTTYEFSHSDKALIYVLRNLSLSSTILSFVLFVPPYSFSQDFLFTSRSSYNEATETVLIYSV